MHDGGPQFLAGLNDARKHDQLHTFQLVLENEHGQLLNSRLKPAGRSQPSCRRFRVATIASPTHGDKLSQCMVTYLSYFLQHRWGKWGCMRHLWTQVGTVKCLHVLLSSHMFKTDFVINTKRPANQFNFALFSWSR